MKLGEMLVRDGRLTEAQLETALKYQARDGGRLGTVLVEHGFVDLEALTVYLGLELGIPIATGAMLERAKRAAVRLLQPFDGGAEECGWGHGHTVPVRSGRPVDRSGAQHAQDGIALRNSVSKWAVSGRTRR